MNRRLEANAARRQQAEESGISSNLRAGGLFSGEAGFNSSVWLRGWPAVVKALSWWTCASLLERSSAGITSHAVEVMTDSIAVSCSYCAPAQVKKALFFVFRWSASRSDFLDRPRFCELPLAGAFFGSCVFADDGLVDGAGESDSLTASLIVWRERQKSMCSLNRRSLAGCGTEHIGHGRRSSSEASTSVFGASFSTRPCFG
jgi:hypothetical protein